jgi:6-phosphogluconate dehydrogenase
VSREIGVVGLGKIGLGVTRRWLRAGFSVVGLDTAAAAREAAERAGARVVASLGELVAALAPPRVVWLVLPAGRAVTEVVEALAEALAAGDLVVDAGNSDYRDSLARAAALERRRIGFLDVGTSGGIHGEEQGFCLMVGGDEGLIERVRPLLEALAPGRDRGWGRAGATGAGHFAKMVHNGIEYGLMQAYAEGFAILDARNDLDLAPQRIAGIWRQGSIIRSWLLDLAAECLEEPETLAGIAPDVADSGLGRAAVREAIELGVPAPVITASLLQRLRSRSEGGFAERLLAALRRQFGGHAVEPAPRSDPGE